MIIHAPLTRTVDNPWQTRPIDTDYVINELAPDIRRNGLMQSPSGRLIVSNAIYNNEPVTETFPMPVDGQEWDSALYLQLAVGHHRRAAYLHLAAEYPDEGWDTIPIKIGRYDDQQMAEMAWSENAKRKNLTSLQEARAIQRYMTDFDATQAQTGKAFGLNRATIANKLRLLTLPPEIQQANNDGRLSERQALALKTIVDTQALVGDNTNWPGVHPDEYIQRILADPDAYTSDAIRDWGSHFTRRAGKPLPAQIATLDCTDSGSDQLIQPATCKGCPSRIQDQCLNAPCLAAKTSHFGQAHAISAAHVIQAAHSIDDADFAPYTYAKDSDKLVALLRAGGCDHIVIGWTNDSDYRIRPLHPKPDSDGTAQCRTPFDTPEEAVILGHHGPIKECQHYKAIAPEQETAEDTGEDTGPNPNQPSQDLKDHWYKADAAQMKTIQATLKETLIEALKETLTDPGPLTALLATRVGSDSVGDPDQIADKLADRWVGWRHLPGYSHIYYGEALQVMALASVDGRAILDQALGKSPADALNARAIRILHFCDYASAGLKADYNAQDERRAVLGEYEQAGPTTDPETNTLIHWLNHFAEQTPEDNPLDDISRRFDRITGWITDNALNGHNPTPEAIQGNITNLDRLLAELSDLGQDDSDLYANIGEAQDDLYELAEETFLSAQPAEASS